jgi:5'-methylthioadenosine phosphorylase
LSTEPEEIYEPSAEYSGPPVKIGVLGGTGLYQMDGLTNLREVAITTPYGNPSDVITIGELEGAEVAFLPRHGRGHRILPSEIPARANIYALKTLGVERLLSVSAVGSLKQQIAPLDMVVPDQIIDRTRLRPSTFFGDGLVGHVAYGEPFCPVLSDLLATAADDTEANVHRGGTYLVMEGPAFSTRAESRLYQSWGASIIGMTASPEAKLAREAEMCFAVLATATDYDAWHESHADVTVEMVLSNLAKNATTSQAALRKLMPRVPEQRTCDCGSALATALVTAKELVPEETLQRLGPLVSKYMS